MAAADQGAISSRSMENSTVEGPVPKSKQSLLLGLTLPSRAPHRLDVLSLFRTQPICFILLPDPPPPFTLDAQQRVFLFLVNLLYNNLICSKIYQGVKRMLADSKKRL